MLDKFDLTPKDKQIVTRECNEFANDREQAEDHELEDTR